MIARVAIAVLLVACSSRSDDARKAQAEAEAQHWKAERERARSGMERQRARALLGPRYFRQREEVDTKIDEHRAAMQVAREERDKATTAAQRKATSAKLDAIGAELDVLFAQAKQLGDDMLVESERIDKLPDRCFTRPTPDDCKLAPELQSMTQTGD